MPSLVFNTGKALDGRSLWTSGNYDFAIMRNDYVENADQATMTAVLAAGTEATGYSRAPVPTPARTIDNTNDRVDYAFADILLSAIASGQTIAGVLIYDATIDTNDGTRIPIAYLEFSSDLVANGGDVTISDAPPGFRLS